MGVLAACAPVARPTGTGDVLGSEPPKPQQVLSIVCRSEPLRAVDSTSNRAAIVPALFSANLGAYDESEAPVPILAEALPSLNTDSWVLLPDGKMETTFRLRPGLRWHDGTGLVAEDFRFGWRVKTALVDWGVDQPSAANREIENVLTPDPRTVVIRWRGPYGEAQVPSLAPRPRHLLETALESGTAESFGSHPYWFGEHIGAGPYRLTAWEPGVHIEGAAFDQYVRGRPKIDRVRVTWSSDPNATLARLLAGDAHLAVDDSLQFQQALTLKREWREGAPLILIANRLRYNQFQHRSEFVDPPAIQDVRVRRAITHAIDRPGLVEAMLEGEGTAADTIVPPTVGYYAEADRVITKYPYDPRRTEQLMAEAGFTKGSDGFLASPAGRFSPKVQGTAEGQEGQETTIIVDMMRRSGIDALLTLIPAAQRDASDELKATYPAMSTNNATLDRDPGLNKYVTSTVASPANRWSGSNKMGWSNPEYDRLYDGYRAALEAGQRDRFLVQMLKLVSEEAPVVPYYYNYLVAAHTQSLSGPRARAPGGSPHLNVHEWQWNK